MREVYHMGLVPDIQAQVMGNHTAIRYRDDEKGIWIPVTWKEFADQIHVVACAMLANGVKCQENMAVFSQNMPESLKTDYAAYAVRAVTVPLYATSSESQVKYIINDASVRILFVGEQQQYDVAIKILPICPSLEKIIIYDPKVKKAPHDVVSVYFDEFIKDAETPERLQQLKDLKSQLSEDDLAHILYTSGTTGESKGVMLHHSCFVSQFKAHFKVLPILFEPNQSSMDFLPLTHVFERGWTFLCMEAGVEICVNRDPHQILRSIQELHPTMMCSVPRFWEKVYDGVQAKIAAMNPTMQKVVTDALKIGEEYNLKYKLNGIVSPWTLSLKYKFFDKTVFYMLKKAIGFEHGTFFPTAGAAIPPTVEKFIHTVGINMIAGYGLTESTATVSCDYGTKTLGSIGRPLPGIDVKIGENNEIMVRGGGITHGYYKKENATREAFDEEGYFHTGDAGYLKNGELFLTDRIKDLYKTSNGKYIAPQVLEGLFCVDKYIDQIVIIADKRKFVSALIIPAYDELKKYANQHGIDFDNQQQLLDNAEIHQMMMDRINTMQQGLAGYEQVKRFTLLPEPFSMAKGEITNTLKVKRPVVNEHFKDLIDKMYE